MSLTSGILDAGLAFLALCAMFRPLEMAYPAREGQRFFRPQWVTDLCYMVGQYLFFNGAVFWVLGFAERWVHAVVPAGVRHSVGGVHWLAQAVLVILLGDFLIYWGHRAQHRFTFLWRFHSIHHSVEHLDWLAAHREHPVDSIYTIFLVNLPIFALGFPVRSLAYFAMFRGLWAIFIHSNVRLPIGPLRMFIGAPELHHWHHERARESGNYANVSPLMDLLFGTYRCPHHEPPALGIDESMPSGYFGQLLDPFTKLAPRKQQPDSSRKPPYNDFDAPFVCRELNS